MTHITTYYGRYYCSLCYELATKLAIQMGGVQKTQFYTRNPDNNQLRTLCGKKSTQLARQDKHSNN